jgi:hypothetical protein
MAQANEVRVYLFEGERSPVQDGVNEFLSALGSQNELIGFEYNYQGPEFDSRSEAHPATHGVLVAIKHREATKIDTSGPSNPGLSTPRR